MLQTKVLEKFITHSLCSVTFFSKSRAVYEIMWKNMVERDRLQMIMWRMRVACWMTKATHTHTRSEYVILNCIAPTSRSAGYIISTLLVLYFSKLLLAWMHHVAEWVCRHVCKVVDEIALRKCTSYPEILQYQISWKYIRCCASSIRADVMTDIAIF
jgi:hypothetical protein